MSIMDVRGRLKSLHQRIHFLVRVEVGICWCLSSRWFTRCQGKLLDSTQGQVLSILAKCLRHEGETRLHARILNGDLVEVLEYGILLLEYLSFHTLLICLLDILFCASDETRIKVRVFIWLLEIAKE